MKRKQRPGVVQRACNYAARYQFDGLWHSFAVMASMRTGLRRGFIAGVQSERRAMRQRMKTTKHKPVQSRVQLT